LLNNSFNPIMKIKTANIFVRMDEPNIFARKVPIIANKTPQIIDGIQNFQSISLFFVWTMIDSTAMGMKKSKFIPCASSWLVLLNKVK